MAYCNPADVKAYLNITGTEDDALIAALIERAQKIVDRHCDRVFEVTADSTRYFDAIGPHIDGGTLWLDRDLCAVTTVTNGDGSAIAAGNRTTVPRNETPYTGIRLLSAANVWWTYTTEYMNAISVVGRWGYSTTAPADIEQAAVRLAAYLYRQRDAQMYDVTAIEAGVVLQPLGIPPDVRMMLAPYKRMR